MANSNESSGSARGFMCFQSGSTDGASPGSARRARMYEQCLRRRGPAPPCQDLQEDLGTASAPLQESYYQETLVDSSDEGPIDPALPRLILVLASERAEKYDPLLRQALQDALAAECFHVENLGMEGSREIWALALGEKNLRRVAVAEGFRKKQEIFYRTPEWKEVLEEHWVPYTQATQPCSFEPADMLALLQARAYHAVLPEDARWQAEDGQQAFGQLESLARSGSVLALCVKCGLVEAITGLHDSAGEDLWSLWPQLLRLKSLRSPPMWQLVQYFGVPTAQYFLFLHEFTCWMCWPALLGVILFIIPGAPWETGFAAVFNVLTGVWSTLFIENWKRKNWNLKHEYCTTDRGDRMWDPAAPAYFQVASERLETAFQDDSVDTSRQGQRGSLRRTLTKAYLKIRRRSSVDTKLIRINRLSSSHWEVLYRLKNIVEMCVLFALIFVVITLLLWIGEVAERESANVLIQNAPVVLYLLVAFYLEKFYLRIGKQLTLAENHATYEAFLLADVTKSAFFQLVNYVGFFVYVAFWMQDMNYLSDQLFVFLTAKQLLALCQENLVPIINHWYSERAAATVAARAKKQDDVSGASSDTTASSASKSHKAQLAERCWTDLKLQNTDLSFEYLQFAILFATTMWFAVIFPLGPLCALVMAYVSRWSDAYKLLKLNRRAAPLAADLTVSEAWIDIFEVIATGSVVVNVGLLAVQARRDLNTGNATSGTGWTPVQLFFLEHALLVFKAFLSWSIPDKPEAICIQDVALDRAQRYSQILVNDDGSGAACTPLARASLTRTTSDVGGA